MSEQRQIGLHPARSLIARSLSLVEDAAYVGLGILLSISALTLLATGFRTFITAVAGRALGDRFVGLLDQMLLVMLIIELLYTVQVSFREHGLVAEPFLLVALIAVIRRILVVTAEAAHLPQASSPVFQHAMIELGILTLMVLVLVASVVFLQRYPKREADRESR
jgi:uncharacterized membrane protein (DUF373 family)